MKNASFAYITLIVIIIAVVCNSLMVSHLIKKTEYELCSIDGNIDSGGSYTELFEKYKKRQRYIGLTVSHDDLTAIEDCFLELIGAIDAKDEESFIITKSRLSGALCHLRRLSGINADSIF